MPVQTRKIGNDDVAAIGLGLMGISVFYGTVGSDEERFKVLDAALAEGSTNWDTADMYGDSEELVGKWFKRTGKRDQIFIATKTGFTMDGPRNEPEYIKTMLEKSLARLGVETIDLYYIHRIQSSIPIEKTIAYLAEFVKAGKIKYIGLSECSAATVRRAHAVHPISAVQVEYSPFALDIEDEKNGLLKTCRELGIAVIAYSPLGRGLLTGTYKSPDDFDEEGDFRKYFPKFSKENFPNILEVVKTLEDIGKKHNATSGQVTLAWLLKQEGVIPIPGTKKIKYLQENMAASKIELTKEEVEVIRVAAQKADSASVAIGAVDRYPAQYLSALFADTVEL